MKHSEGAPKFHMFVICLLPYSMVLSSRLVVLLTVTVSFPSYFCLLLCLCGHRAHLPLFMTDFRFPFLTFWSVFFVPVCHLPLFTVLRPFSYEPRVPTVSHVFKPQHFVELKVPKRRPVAV